MSPLVEVLHNLFYMTWSQADHSTVLIAAFSGWNDAATAATDAVRYLVEHLSTTRVACIDSADFYDMQLTRPNQCTVTGRKNIVWPQMDFYRVDNSDTAADNNADSTVSGADSGYSSNGVGANDPQHESPNIVLAVGPEPSLHWKDFTRSFLRIAEDLDVDRIILLCSMFDDVAYTRQLPLSIEDGNRASVSEDSYNGPIGIPSVINLTAGDMGYESEALWICVPQYLGDMSSNPQACLDLLHRIEKETHTKLPLSPLLSKVRGWRAEADMLVRYNESLASYVHQLEKKFDQKERKDLEKAVSSGSDQIAQEAEDFLRTFDTEHDDRSNKSDHDDHKHGKLS